MLVWLYDSTQEVRRETSVLKCKITKILLTILWPCKVKHGALCFGGKRIREHLMYILQWCLVTVSSILVLKRKDVFFSRKYTNIVIRAHKFTPNVEIFASCPNNYLYQALVIKAVYNY